MRYPWIPDSSIMALLLGLAISALGISAPGLAAEEGECVWVEVRAAQESTGKDELVITYPSPIGPTRLRADFAALESAGGWPLSPPNIVGDDGRTYRAFARGIVDRASGDLPWEPIALALADHSRLHISFRMQPPYYYRGPSGSLENQYARVTFVRVPSHHVFGVLVELTNTQPPTVAQLGDNLVAASDGSGSAEQGDGMRTLLWVVVGACGALMAFSVVMIVRGLRRRRRGSAG